MQTFTIDCDNSITAFASLEEAKAADIAGAQYFSSQEELEQLAASWSPYGTHGPRSSKLLELWNSIPGVAPVKKFESRETALARIWKAAQALTPPGAPQGAPDAPKAKGSRKKATSVKKAAPPRKGGKKARQGGQEARDGSKKAEVLELLRRAKGATLAEIMTATGWQAHTVRGFISGALVKKQGLKVESYRNEDKERTYRLLA
jgi:hypothetical protein